MTIIREEARRSNENKDFGALGMQKDALKSQMNCNIDFWTTCFEEAWKINEMQPIKLLELVRKSCCVRSKFRTNCVRVVLMTNDIALARLLPIDDRCHKIRLMRLFGRCTLLMVLLSK
jgi:hypothetical protein